MGSKRKITHTEKFVRVVKGKRPWIDESFLTSFTHTLTPRLRPSTMLLPGGCNTTPSIHDYHAWRSIISLYLVHNKVNFKSKTNYLFLATSIDVEWLFSRGHGLLSHTHNCLSAQSTHTLLCLGSWSKAGFVHDNYVKAVAALPDVVGVDSQVLENEQ